MNIVYQWRVLEKDKRGRDKWRILRWHMGEAQAADWSANNAKRIEKVPNSSEIRTPLGLKASGGIMCTPGFGAL